MPDPEFLLLGDALWLDFVNTLQGVGGGPDALPDPAAYLRWTKANRVASPSDRTAYEDALRFRASLAELAKALDLGRKPPPSAVEVINARLLTVEGRQRLLRIAGAWRIRFAPARPPTAPEAIALSAAQTLANPLVFVRRCANPECGLFFADDTPGQGRRWCSANRCGQRGRIERRRTTRAPLLAER
ncbi:MAG TPA: ABATE domain-containing protein [Gemmatimonadales bacterium]|nr:ABATE domain-containing protein [Gemmatimonadales bacterium]